MSIKRVPPRIVRPPAIQTGREGSFSRNGTTNKNGTINKSVLGGQAKTTPPKK